MLPPVEALIRRLTGVPGREDRLRHLEVLPAREAVHEDWPAWVPDDVRGAYAAQGVARPWRHQVVAADAAHAGDHVIVATGTASGKSLAYQLPALSAIRAARGSARRARRLGALPRARPRRSPTTSSPGSPSLGLDVRLAAHDGDSSREERDWTRDFGEYVLTNPDMLHRSLLPSHHRWSRFLGSLQYVVVDECHHYRGVFGAHVSHVLRRLRRVCAMYGAHPTFVLASATVAQPEVTARRLTGLDVVALITRRLPARAGVAAAVGAALHLPRRGERRPGAPGRLLRGRRPAGRPGGRGRADAGLHPLAARRGTGGADRRRAARRGRPVAAGQGRGLPRRLPPRGAAGARGGAAPRRPDGAGRDQRPRARHRHQRPRRRADRGLPRHARGLLAAGGSRRAGRAGRPRACWSPRTTRSTPTSSPTPRRSSGRRSRRRSSTRPTRT